MKLEEFMLEQEKIRKRIDDLAKECRSVVVDGFKNIFDMYPQVESVSWTQYTPYFNDGEECNFSVHADYCNINNVSIDDMYNYTSKKYYSEYADLEIPGKEIINLLYNFSPDNLKYAFGDHCMITITKEGIEIDDYSHD